jgi:hypothetical protein
MNTMEHKIVDYLYAYQVEIDDIIKIGDELLRVVSVEDNDTHWEIFFADEYGEIDYEQFGNDQLISIWLPFD